MDLLVAAQIFKNWIELLQILVSVGNSWHDIEICCHLQVPPTKLHRLAQLLLPALPSSGVIETGNWFECVGEIPARNPNRSYLIACYARDAILRTIESGPVAQQAWRRAVERCGLFDPKVSVAKSSLKRSCSSHSQKTRYLGNTRMFLIR